MSLSTFIEPFIPDAEKTETMRWLRVVESLDQYDGAFAADVNLFECADAFRQFFSVNPPPLGTPFADAQLFNWTFIAARDGALQIFHFRKTLDEIRRSIITCPTLQTYIAADDLKLVSNLFNSYFRDHGNIRDSVAHQAQVFSNPQKHGIQTPFEKSGIKFDGEGLMVMNHIEGRTFSTTYYGELLTYEISVASLSKLRKVVEQLAQAFTPVRRHILSLQTGQKLTPKI